MIIKTFPWKNEQESKTRLKVDGFWFKRPLNIMVKTFLRSHKFIRKVTHGHYHKIQDWWYKTLSQYTDNIHFSRTFLFKFQRQCCFVQTICLI